MKQRNVLIFSISCFLMAGQLWSQGSSTLGGSNTTGSSGLSGSSTAPALPPLQKQKTEPSKDTTPDKLPLPKIPKHPASINQRASYYHPGIIVNQNSTWVGGDHLLNVANNIAVYVTVIMPEGDLLPLDNEHIKSLIEKKFSDVGIIPSTLAPTDQPPLPFFQVQILAYPVEDGYVATCVGRLFESVILKRFNLDENMAFQAITWEKSALVVGPTKKMPDLIDTNVTEIAQVFSERYKAFAERKNKL